jgi:ADP-heptose:LPS heptosyltransferase
MSKFLIIQTAFIGDIVLATPIVEKLRRHFPEARIDFLLRRGNESLLENHPHLRQVIVWDKKNGKYGNLLKIAKQVRSERYDYVINCHRFASSGFITALSRAKNKIGFENNPFAASYTRKVAHDIDSGKHEVERNLTLIDELTDSAMERPKLYPGDADYDRVREYQQVPYVCIAPTSVWFTKQWPADKWVELIGQLGGELRVYLVGGLEDKDSCRAIVDRCSGSSVTNVAGELTLLQTAALLQKARTNYVNDSAPLHLASAMNAPVTAVFCSTIPQFGFGPLSDNSRVVETPIELDCRPCGLHGFRKCPEDHFKCAWTIEAAKLLDDQV